MYKRNLAFDAEDYERERKRRAFEASIRDPPPQAPPVSIPADGQVQPENLDTAYYSSGIAQDSSAQVAREQLATELGTDIQNIGTSTLEKIDTNLKYVRAAFWSPTSTAEQKVAYDQRIKQLTALRERVSNAVNSGLPSDVEGRAQALSALGNDIRQTFSDTQWAGNSGAKAETDIIQDAINRFAFIKSVFAPDEKFNMDINAQMLYSIVSDDQRKGRDGIGAKGYDVSKLPKLADTLNAAYNTLLLDPEAAAKLSDSQKTAMFKNTVLKGLNWNELSEEKKAAYYEFMKKNTDVGFNVLSDLLKKDPSEWTVQDQRVFAIYKDAYVVEKDYKHYLVTADDPQWNGYDAKLFDEQLGRGGNAYYEPKDWQIALGWTVGALSLVFGVAAPFTLPAAGAMAGSLALGVTSVFLPPVGGPDWLQKLYFGLSIGIGGAQLIYGGISAVNAIRAGAAAAAAETGAGIVTATANVLDDVATSATTPLLRASNFIQGSTVGSMASLVDEAATLGSTAANSLDDLTQVAGSSVSASTRAGGTGLFGMQQGGSQYGRLTGVGLGTNNAPGLMQRGLQAIQGTMERVVEVGKNTVNYVLDGIADVAGNQGAYQLLQNVDEVDEAITITRGATNTTAPTRVNAVFRELENVGPATAAANFDLGPTVNGVAVELSANIAVRVVEQNLGPTFLRMRQMAVSLMGEAGGSMIDDAVNGAMGAVRQGARAVVPANVANLALEEGVRTAVNAAGNTPAASRFLTKMGEGFATLVREGPTAKNVMQFTKLVVYEGARYRFSGAVAAISSQAERLSVGVQRMYDGILSGNPLVLQQNAQDLVKALANNEVLKVAVKAGAVGYASEGLKKQMEGNAFYEGLSDLMNTIETLDEVIGLDAVTEMKDTIVGEVVTQMLQVGRVDRFQGEVDIQDFKDVAAHSYSEDPPQRIKSYDLYYKSDTMNVYVDENTKRVMVSVRGTKPTDLRDVRADASIAINKLSSSDRYKYDRQQFDTILRQLSQNDYSFYMTGHSLGGAIVSQMKRDYPFIRQGVTFNSAVQPIDLLVQQNRTVKRFYTEGDPLYQYGGGRFLNNTGVQGSRGQNQQGQGIFELAQGFLASHALDNFTGTTSRRARV